MSEKKYVAYVGSYTHGSSRQGIHVYDVDVENGTLTERSSVEVSNASHMAVSKNGKYLYSIEDEGVAVFERDKNGDLSRINSVNIDGMRGCFLSTDVDAASPTRPMVVSAMTTFTGSPLEYLKFASYNSLTDFAMFMVCSSRDPRTSNAPLRPSIVGLIPITG